MPPTPMADGSLSASPRADADVFDSGQSDGVHAVYWAAMRLRRAGDERPLTAADVRYVAARLGGRSQ